MTQVLAESKYVRMSPRKLALVADQLRGLAPGQALSKLALITKSAATPLIKIIKSATANATENAKLKENNLKIKSIEVTTGPAFKRWQPVSRGRAHPYKKRTAHIRVILED
ncbi:50S ribosomal protein L22 [Candidatus Microgenomates bacterium]|nr:50S ribosomal protein L22 [Candidatus Microgenomates bacterium]